MKKVYLSNQAHPALTSYLTRLGYAIEYVDHEGSTYYPVSTHPDIFMCRAGVWENPAIFPGNPQKLRPSYPGNIIYNAVCTGKYFIHNLKYTDPGLLEAAREWKGAQRSSAEGSCRLQRKEDLILVDVPQGYTRCCLLPVDDSSFITSDAGIAKALMAAGADVLLIEKGHIDLPGFDYGFIGGCAGHIMIPVTDSDAASDLAPTIIFNGDLSAHPNFEKIAAFIHERNIDTVYFEDLPLTDIGSILALW